MKLCCCYKFKISDKPSSFYYKLYYAGFSIFVFGILTIAFCQPLYHWLVSTNLILKDGTPFYDAWVSAEKVPVYFKVHIFNWTNPVPSLMQHEKPKLAEIGPYVFRIREIKTDVKFNPNDTVSFRYRRKFNFVPEMSKGFENDHITSVNPVAITMAYFFKNTPAPTKQLLQTIMDTVEKSLYITKAAETWIFDGYADKMASLAAGLEKAIPQLHFPKRFAWYYGKNMTDYYDINMYTGESDVNDAGLMHTLNYKTDCESYFGQCDRVKGSMGALWPQNTAEKNETYFFFPDMCGAFRLRNSGPEKVHGIDGVRFDGTIDTFDNGLKFEENKCYQRDGTNILKSGIRDLSKLLKAPLFTSFPHFFGADEYFRNAVEGLKPISHKHNMRLVLQKDFSVVLDASFKLQLNMQLQPIGGFPSLKNVPKLLIPILWFEMTPELPQDTIDDLKLVFNVLPYLLLCSGAAFVILGGTLLVGGLYLHRKSIRSDTYETTR